MLLKRSAKLIIIMFSIAAILATGCASKKKKPRTLKPGKPIPCPVKDC